MTAYDINQILHDIEAGREGDGYSVSVTLVTGVVVTGACHRPHNGRWRIDVPAGWAIYSGPRYIAIQHVVMVEVAQ